MDTQSSSRSRYFAPDGRSWKIVPLQERLDYRVDRRGPDECWPWMGYRDRQGYGVIRAGGRTQKAHRVVMGAPDDVQCVMHTCDNPPCCNPAHLRLGTHADNVHDMVAKGRNRHGSVSPPSDPFDPDDPDDRRHGTSHGYNGLKCRCERCRDAVAAYMREYMRTHPEQRAKKANRKRERPLP